jgi:hypothetical protein
MKLINNVAESENESGLDLGFVESDYQVSHI